MLAFLEQEHRPPRGVSLAEKLTKFHVERGGGYPLLYNYSNYGPWTHVHAHGPCKLGNGRLPFFLVNHVC